MSGLIIVVGSSCEDPRDVWCVIESMEDLGGSRWVKTERTRASGDGSK